MMQDDEVKEKNAYSFPITQRQKKPKGNYHLFLPIITRSKITRKFVLSQKQIVENFQREENVDGLLSGFCQRNLLVNFSNFVKSINSKKIQKSKRSLRKMPILMIRKISEKGDKKLRVNGEALP